jgi:hypothetical protein
VIGRTYLEWAIAPDGTHRLPPSPVVVLARWGHGGPRNVLIRRADGTLTIRPFRGLRKI